ncbi:MAG: hypothetical protein R2765_10720 [Ferruginibacter sp.]
MAQRIVGPLGATIILVVTAFSCFGTVSADVMKTAHPVHCLRELMKDYFKFWAGCIQNFAACLLSFIHH